MGNCTYKRNVQEIPIQTKHSRNIEIWLNTEVYKDNNIIGKFVMFGHRGSGKSTFLKQFDILNGATYDKEKRQMFINIIRTNIFLYMQTLCAWNQFIKNDNNISRADIHLVQIKNEVLTLSKCTVVDSTLIDKIYRLWNNPVIKDTLRYQTRFQIDDSAAYFFERLPEIMKHQYVPSMEDVLRARIPIQTFFEVVYKHEGYYAFQFIDISGQTNNKKKWLHCFEDMSAIVFVAALSAYNEIFYKDGGVSQMDKTLNLFEEITSRCLFNETSVILFLNKCDIFRKKLKEAPLEIYFPDFQPTHTRNGSERFNEEDYYNEALHFITNMFESYIYPDRVCYIHHITAINVKEVENRMGCIKDMLYRPCLRDAGLV